MESCKTHNTLYEFINFKSKRNKLFKESYLYKQFYKLSDGLKYLHEKNLIHCDLSPKNIFVTDEKQFKIADLGSLRKEGFPIHQYSDLYLMPEYLKKLDNNHVVYANKKIDYWALGKLFFECCVVTNQIDFTNLNNASIIKQIDRLENYPKIKDLIKNAMTVFEYKKHYSYSNRSELNTISISSTYQNTSKPLCSLCHTCIEEEFMRYECLHAFHGICLSNYREKSGLNKFISLLCPKCRWYNGKAIQSK